MNAYKHLLIEMHDEVACIRLVRTQLDETEILELGDELIHLTDRTGKLVLVLGPERPEILYSVFLAKLIGVRNAARRVGGELVLCQVSPILFSVFEAGQLHRAFTFRPTLQEALAFWQGQPVALSADA
jgi:anti-anti-sigma regulatory factor